MDFQSGLRTFIIASEWFSITYFTVIYSIYGLLLLSAIWQVWRHALRVQNERLWRVLGSELTPSISILVPAYNEEATILTSVHSFLSISYPNLEVVVTNDGSSDRTLDVMKEAFSLEPVQVAIRTEIPTAPIRGIYRSVSSPNLIVIDKENIGSRADAVNAALKNAKGELVCAVDADTIIERDGLQRLVRPFVVDENVVAAGGTIKAVNGSSILKGRIVTTRVPRNPVAGVQVVEYLRAFLFGRIGWNKLGGNLNVSGAFGLFRRSAMMKIGGYAWESLGEDMELITRLRGSDHGPGVPRNVDFVPDPVAWTEVPPSLKSLGNQRDRWQRGLMDVVLSHRHLFFNPKHGVLGIFIFPYYVFAELLAPVIELFGIVITIIGLATGILNAEHAVLFLLAVYGYSFILSLTTMIMDELAFSRYGTMKDRWLLLGWLLLESLGYRQLTLYWRLRGLYKFLIGSRGWGQMERQGFEID